MLHAAVLPSLPATAVTHTVSGRFSPNLPSGVKETIVVRHNHLSLYRSESTSSAAVGRSHARSAKKGPLMKLVAEASLNSPVVSVGVCKPSAATASGPASGTFQEDVLALLFDDFHISFLQFNLVCLRFDTIALVQLDDRDTQMERCPLDPIMRVDPTGTYVAVLVQRRQLFIFPVQQRVSLEEAAANPVATTAIGDAAVSGSAPGAGAGDAGSGNKKAKVALDAWGDDDEDDDDQNGDGQPTSVTDGGKNTIGGTVGEAGQATHPGAAGATSHKVSLMNEEILRIGAISKIFLSELKPAPLNVRDFQFVETTGGEPLLALLYENNPTWAGRVKLVEWRSRTVESDMLTCSVLWLKWTLANTATPKALTIGDVEHLPYNTTHIVPLPSFQQVPSAVLCVGQNTLVHVSIKNGYGAYVNANGKEEAQAAKSSAVVYETARWASASQEKSLDLVRTNLSFANALIVVEQRDNSNNAEEEGASLQLLALTEEDGTVVKLSLHAGGYMVSAVELTIVVSGFFGNCWCNVAADQYFLGSHSGNSLLVRWDGSAKVDAVQTFVGLGPLHDAEVVDCTPQDRGSDGALDAYIENSPFADLYHNVSIEPEPQLSTRDRRKVMDLALCTGEGASGAIHILRQSMRDSVMRSEEVNAVSVFFMESQRALRGEHRKKRSRDDGDGATSSSRDSAAHLIMTGGRFTILFAIRSDSVQLVRGPALDTAVRTVFAAELSWAPALLQVTETKVCLSSLDGKRLLNQISPGAILEAEGGGVSFGSIKRAFLIPSIKAVAIHFDSGYVAYFKHIVSADGKPTVEDARRRSDGDGEVSEVTATLVFTDVKAVTFWESQGQLVAIQQDALVFYDLATSKMTRLIENFAVLPSVAVDGLPIPLEKLSERLNKSVFPSVTHMNIFDHPSGDTARAAATGRGVATLSLITSSGELVLYRIVDADCYGPWRLIKSTHHLLDVVPEPDRMESIEEKKRRLAVERANLEGDTVTVRESSERLISFQDVGGFDGVYVCGQNPVFLTYDEEREELVLTRHQTTGAVRGFAPFRSRLVEGGYVYCREGYVDFASMQMFGQSLGSGWWVQRVPLGVTPHKIVYSSAAHSCYVVTSSPQPFSLKKASFDVHLRINWSEEGQKTVTVEHHHALPPLSAAKTGAPVPVNERYEVRFFSCEDWNCTDTFPLEENEKVLSAQCISLPRDTSMDASPRSAMGPVCALATAFPLGEDITTRGRLILLASRHAEGEKKLRVIHSEPLKGPATAVTGIEGNVAVAVGGTIRVFRCDYRTKKLETVAMLYAGAYVTHMSAFRNYLIFGDLFTSATLARFSAENHTLTVLGKDVNQYSVVCADMLYHGGSFGLVASDSDRNIAVMGYTPRVQESVAAQGNRAGNRRDASQQQAQGGEKRTKLLESLLTMDGEYRLAGGSLVKLLRFRSQTTAGSPAVYVTNYGEVGFIVPLSDRANLTSQFIAGRLPMFVPTTAGLPPRMFLGFRQDDAKFSMRAKERLMHAPLLKDMFLLDTRERKALAARASTQVESVFDVGAVIYSETALF